MEPALLHVSLLIFQDIPALLLVTVNSLVRRALITFTRINLALQITAQILTLSLEIKAWTGFVTQSAFRQNPFTRMALVSKHAQLHIPRISELMFLRVIFPVMIPISIISQQINRVV